MTVTFGPWRGDLTALRDMAIHSWRHEYGIESFPDTLVGEMVWPVELPQRGEQEAS